jgi:5-methylcytosine-specific restriction endonuclease McrA
MTYPDYLLRRIYNKTRGFCHLCGRKMILRYYGTWLPRGWEVDHDRPSSRGGTDSYFNLLAAHTKCNRSKGYLTTREYKRAVRTSTRFTSFLGW